MKHRWIPVCLSMMAMILLTMPSCMLPTKQIKVPSVRLKIIDEQTGLPIEGIQVHTDCGYMRPKTILGIVAQIDSFTGKTYFSADFVSDKDGVVTIPKRTKLSSNYGRISEGYWINLTGHFESGYYSSSKGESLQNPNTLYDGVFLVRYNIAPSGESQPWQREEGNALVPMQQQSSTAEGKVFILKLHRRTSPSPPQ